MSNLLELNFQRRKLRAEAQGLLDAAATAGRDLTLDERIKFDSLAARIADFDAQILERRALRAA